MKFLFLLVSIVCAVSLSFLGMIYATGKAPFFEQEAVPVADVSQKKDEKPQESLSILADKKHTVDTLAAALKAEKEIYERKLIEFGAREDEMVRKEAVINELKQELENTQKKLESKIVELDAAEQVNIKRLAEVYGKMTAESAAELLQKMEIDRAARILNLITDRQAAAILGAAVAQGAAGSTTAVGWSDSIRRMIINKEG